jgi:hypothetical protein
LIVNTEVSQDNIVFFQLDPVRAPGVDTLYPTDGQGQFGLPVNPLLGPPDFADKTAAEIRALYAGSAGGTAYDLAWARDDAGLPVSLADVRYVRIDLLSGRAEIDGFAVVPEPSTWMLISLGLALMLGPLSRRRSRRGMDDPLPPEAGHPSVGSPSPGCGSDRNRAFAERL